MASASPAPVRPPPPPRAAYIHVPFCRHRCGYCNFTVVAGRIDLVGPYLQALRQELAWLGTPQAVATLYIGGGTPSRLPPRDLAELLTTVADWFPLDAGGEFTVEANPEDLDDERLQVLAAFGVNRLSVGVQSFQAAKLRWLERDHSPAELRAAWARASRYLDNLSLDLMFAAPGETRAAWQRDLDEAVALAPRHVSTYGLTYEKGTRFWSRRAHGELASAAEELELAMYEAALDTLSRAGFEHYEVSNFAQPGFHSRHNEVYWTGQAYFAAGPGAARFVGGVRETNHRSTTTYLRRVLAGRSPVAERESLGPEEAARERLVFGLRRLAGIDLGEFEAATGFSVERLVAAPLARFVAWGLLERDGTRLRLTRRGLVVSDALWPEFLATTR